MLEIISTNNLNQARKEIQKLKKEKKEIKEIIVYAQDDNFNRKIFENLDVDIVIGLEFGFGQHNRSKNTGLNEVLCNLAKKNNIKIGIDISRIIKLEKLEKAKILSKVMKNIFLCKKYGVKIVLFGENCSKQDVMSFFLSFGGSTKQARDAAS